MSRIPQSPAITTSPFVAETKRLSGSSLELEMREFWHALEDAPEVASPRPRRDEPITPVVPQFPTAPVVAKSSPVLAAPSAWNPPASRPTQTPLPPTRRHATVETLTALVPFAKWGVLAALVVIGGLGLSKISAGHASRVIPETHLIQIQPILSGKPLPGAHLTLTPILPPEQSGKLGDLSAVHQLVGRAQLGENGIAEPSIGSGRSGLPAGEYIASLTWCKVEVKEGETVTGPDRVPQIFRSPATSNLRVTVKPGNNSLATLQLVNPKVKAKRVNYDHE